MSAGAGIQDKKPPGSGLRGYNGCFFTAVTPLVRPLLAQARLLDSSATSTRL